MSIYNKGRTAKCVGEFGKYFDKIRNSAFPMSLRPNNLHLDVHFGYLNKDSLCVHMRFCTYKSAQGIDVWYDNTKASLSTSDLDSLYESDELFQISTMYDVQGLQLLYKNKITLQSLEEKLAALRDSII